MERMRPSQLLAISWCQVDRRKVYETEGYYLLELPYDISTVFMSRLVFQRRTISPWGSVLETRSAWWQCTSFLLPHPYFSVALFFWSLWIRTSSRFLAVYLQSDLWERSALVRFFESFKVAQESYLLCVLLLCNCLVFKYRSFLCSERLWPLPLCRSFYNPVQLLWRAFTICSCRHSRCSHRPLDLLLSCSFKKNQALLKNLILRFCL